MSRTPTAEEVLGLYQKAQGKDGTNDDYLAFHRALRVWRESQGPVTREWFVERFGGQVVGVRSGHVRLDTMERIVVSLASPVRCNPTRSDIETLVRVLGGTDAS